MKMMWRPSFDSSAQQSKNIADNFQETQGAQGGESYQGNFQWQVPPHSQFPQEQVTQDCCLAADQDGDLPLHIAVLKEDPSSVIRTVQLMTQHGHSIDLFNNLRQTPLHLAIIMNNIIIARILLNSGANICSADRQGDSALHLACKWGSNDCLMLLLEHPQVEEVLNSLNFEGFSPLHLAVLRNGGDIIKLLVSRNADVDVVDGKSGRTPLFLAVENTLPNMVELLVTLGANVNLANFSGITPLIAATDRGNQIVTSMLISRGAMISPRYDMQ